ncbi:MAG: FAD:protein FMN transferase [Myxococcota bacterium]|nr:FAD:protein FMN transferase [Myxococcota bacterium]
MFGPKPLRPLSHYILPGLFVAALFVFQATRRPTQSNQYELKGSIMGTYWSAKIIATSIPPALPEELVAELDVINQKMSTYISDSEISQFNQFRKTSPFPLSADTLTVIQNAQHISKHSQGAFDISIRPLVNLWGFGSNSSDTTPEEEDIALALHKIGYEKLVLSETHLQKKEPDLEIDLSAIAKGYGVDHIAQNLTHKGYDNFMFEIGGEIKAKGKNLQNVPWRIGIDMPDAERGSIIERIELSNVSIATSGDYRNYYEQNGQRISHTIDARNGRPITHNLASVSVIHESAMLADGWATALNVLGPKQALQIAKEQQLAFMMVLRKPNSDFQIRYSDAFHQYRIDGKVEE